MRCKEGVKDITQKKDHRCIVLWLVGLLLPDFIGYCLAGIIYCYEPIMFDRISCFPLRFT